MVSLIKGFVIAAVAEELPILDLVEEGLLQIPTRGHMKAVILFGRGEMNGNDMAVEADAARREDLIPWGASPTRVIIGIDVELCSMRGLRDIRELAVHLQGHQSLGHRQKFVVSHKNFFTLVRCPIDFSTAQVGANIGRTKGLVVAVIPGELEERAERRQQCSLQLIRNSIAVRVGYGTGLCGCCLPSPECQRQ